jgi:hypothetical protein
LGQTHALKERIRLKKGKYDTMEAVPELKFSDSRYGKAAANLQFETAALF